MRRALLVAALIAPTHAIHASQAGVMTILAPAAPGGGWDQTARALQRAFADVEPRTSIQVDNIAGAAGTIGLARFVRAERGNPSALMVTGLVMLSGIVTSGSPVALGDCIPIARLTGEFEVIVVPDGSPFQRLEDLVGAFRANPGAVSWGGGSAGGTDDLLVRLLAERVNVAPARVNYIAFSGGGAVLPALLGGQVTAGVSGYTEFAGQIQAGQLRVLAISAPSRVEGIAAPTIREAGIDLELQNWRGVMAPPGLSDAERDALTARVAAVAASGAWQQTLRQFGWADLFLSGAEFRQFLLAEQARVEAVLRRLAAGTEATAPAISPHLLSRTAGVAMIILAFVGLGPAALVGLGASRLVRLGPGGPRGSDRDVTAKGAPNGAPSHQAHSAESDEPQSGESDERRSRESHAARSGESYEARSAESHEGRRPESHERAKRTSLLFAALLIQPLTLPLLGFVFSSTLLFAIVARAMGSRRVAVDFAIGFVLAAALFVAFDRGLGVSLPSSPLPGGFI